MPNQERRRGWRIWRLADKEEWFDNDGEFDAAAWDEYQRMKSVGDRIPIVDDCGSVVGFYNLGHCVFVFGAGGKRGGCFGDDALARLKDGSWILLSKKAGHSFQPALRLSPAKALILLIENGVGVPRELESDFLPPYRTLIDNRSGVVGAMANAIDRKSRKGNTRRARSPVFAVDGTVVGFVDGDELDIVFEDTTQPEDRRIRVLKPRHDLSGGLFRGDDVFRPGVAAGGLWLQRVGDGVLFQTTAYAAADVIQERGGKAALPIELRGREDDGSLESLLFGASCATDTDDSDATPRAELLDRFRRLAQNACEATCRLIGSAEAVARRRAGKLEVTSVTDADAWKIIETHLPALLAFVRVQIPDDVAQLLARAWLRVSQREGKSSELRFGDDAEFCSGLHWHGLLQSVVSKALCAIAWQGQTADPIRYFVELANRRAVTSLRDSEMSIYLDREAAEACRILELPTNATIGEQRADWPPDAEWRFQPGEAAFLGQRFPIEGKPAQLLEVLAYARRPQTADELADTISTDNYVVLSKTIRGYLTRIRDVLRPAFGLEDAFNPIPFVDNGVVRAWKLDSEGIKERRTKGAG